MTLPRLLLLGLLGLPFACSTPPRALDLVAPAQAYPGFAGYERAVRTDSSAAQAWFDQGIQLLYGYNHDEAIRSFRQAAIEDPECAMGWWGVAYAAGLHINNTEMSAVQSEIAFEAAGRARAALETRRPGHELDGVESALIEAVSRRYAWPVPEDRSGLDQAYADAMEAAWTAHPVDPDVGALYAESLMNLQPWDLWTHDGEPKGRTLEVVEVLERTLALAPGHPGANHFYIHTVEASNTPERAVPSAERLTDLVPGSGHLVHMPSHIFARVGRYADAADSNAHAIEADSAYFAKAPAPDFYSLYYLHNLHFLSYVAMMEGRYEVSLAAAERLEREVPPPFLQAYVELADGLMSTSLHVRIRFGHFEELLDLPPPPAWRKLSLANWHYARGIALASLGRVAAGREELAAFEAAADDVPEEWLVLNNPAADVLAIGRTMLVGELLYREGDYESAFASLAEGVVLEEALVYDEPPGWMQPVRHALGALLLEQGRAAEARDVYIADLERHPENGWALLGLGLAHAALGDTAAEASATERLARSWTRPDVAPTASCYCAGGELASGSSAAN